MHLLVTNSDLMTALQRVITFKILKYLPEYMNMDKSFFSPREHKCDNYVLLTLKCMQQIRKTNKVLHVSASNHILRDLHYRCKCKEAAEQHIITNHRLRLPITKQTFNKNLEYVMKHFMSLWKSSEVNKVLVEEFERTKGSGVGMLASLLKDNFSGVELKYNYSKHGQKSLSPKVSW